MPAVKDVGEPGAREPHARFDAAAGGNQASRPRRTAQAPPADPTTTHPRGRDLHWSWRGHRGQEWCSCRCLIPAAPLTALTYDAVAALLSEGGSRCRDP